MLQRVNTGHKKLADYATLVGPTVMEQIRALATAVEGKRVLHLSATAFGGGVAEINYTLVPLMRDAGLDPRQLSPPASGPRWGPAPLPKRPDRRDPRPRSGPRHRARHAAG